MSLIPRIVMRFAVLATLPFAGPASCTDFPPGHYSAEAIEARVIDAGTNKPLEGVIVVAHWQLYEGGVAGRTLGPQLMVLETVTDKDGKFSLPAWGPIPRPTGYLDERSPELLLFKPGYEYQSLANPVRTQADHSPVRRSVWNGKTIGLSRFKGAIQDYEDHFESLNRTLENIVVENPDRCDWKKIPNTIRTMNRERIHLVNKGVNPNTLSSIDKRLLLNDRYFAEKGSCGSPAKFFGDLLQ